MTDFLIRIFLRRTDPQREHTALGAFAGGVGIGCNVLLAVMKLTFGILTGSVAIAGDGVNNLTDSASSLVTLAGFRLAQRPADPEHPYGHGRYEYVSGVAVAGLVLLAGWELAKSSVTKIFHPEAVPFTVLTGVILVLSILVKLWMASFYRKVGERIHSQTLLAAAQDSRNDVLATGAVLLCVGAETVFPVHLDGIAGLGVAAFVLYSGVQLCRETISPLLGTQADRELVQALEQLVLSHRRVLGIHDLLIHDYGAGRCFATVHAEMDASESPLSAHDQLDHIEEEALRRLGVHLVIHYDPVDDRNWAPYRTAAENCLTRIAPTGSIHDLRIVTYHGAQTLTFDVTVPYDLPLTDEALQTQLSEALTASGCTLPTKIGVDRKSL